MASDTPQTDRDLIARARSETGAQNTGTVSDTDLYAELDAIKQQVTHEVQAALDGGTIDIYSDAPLEMAEHILYLRTADKRRQRGASGDKVPERPVSRKVSELQRTQFNDPTLTHWRNRAVKAFHEITDGE